MRHLGTLPEEPAAIAFSNILLASGIDHELEREPDGWAIWVRAEEDTRRAGDLLRQYQSSAGPRELEPLVREGAVRRRIREDGVAEDGSPERGRELLRRALPDGLGALTAVLAGTCLAISCAAWAGYDERVFDQLLITRFGATAQGLNWDKGLSEVFKDGEWWRLITPALVHFHVPHLLLNLLCLINLGSAIEARHGTGRLGFLFLTVAVGSNLIQVWLEGPAFCGISGVLYGLLGYIWMKGKFDPAGGLGLHPYTVVLMFIFFILGLGGAFAVAFGVSMANGAHAGGLALGVLWGVVTSLPQIRARWRARP